MGLPLCGLILQSIIWQPPLTIAYLWHIFTLIGSSAVGLLLSICICVGVYIYLQACPPHKQGLYCNGHFWTFLTGWGSHELFTSCGPSFGFGSAPPSFDCQVESYLCCFSLFPLCLVKSNWVKYMFCNSIKNELMFSRQEKISEKYKIRKLSLSLFQACQHTQTVNRYMFLFFLS